VLPATGVEVVRLEVTVSEKGRRPRTGLRREDFVVLEDGKPQPIVQFQAFARSVAAAPAAAKAPAPAEAEEADEMLPARYVVLAIDDVHMEFESLVRSRKALERFLDEDLRRDDRLQATVEEAAVVLDETGRVAATLETVRQSLDLSEADRAKLEQRGLPYTRAVALKPGRYQVRLAARDDGTGLLGSAWRRVEVPDLSLGRLALSQAAAAGPQGAPALLGVQHLPRFARAEKLYVQLQAYNARRGAAGTIDLVCQAAVLRGGAVLATAAPEPMEAGEPGGPVAHLSRIGLRPFEPGEYELRVTVTDRNAGAVATRVVPFTVE
jgi:hypothetical protein